MVKKHGYSMVRVKLLIKLAAWEIREMEYVMIPKKLPAPLHILLLLKKPLHTVGHAGGIAVPLLVHQKNHRPRRINRHKGLAAA